MKLALVVDDIATNRKLLKMLLNRQGLEVIEAADGQQAVEAFNSNNDIDIVFMDIMMPVMDGFEATAKIRQSEGDADRAKAVKIVMVTAMDGQENITKGLDIGADVYITKPYRASEIMAVLESF